jgi:hypothetical protein
VLLLLVVAVLGGAQALRGKEESTALLLEVVRVWVVDWG